METPREREPIMIPYHPLQFSVRDKRTGDKSRWIDIRSGRDVSRRIAVLLRFYH